MENNDAIPRLHFNQASPVRKETQEPKDFLKVHFIYRYSALSEKPREIHNYTKFLYKHKPWEERKNNNDVGLTACFPGDYL